MLSAWIGPAFIGLQEFQEFFAIGVIVGVIEQGLARAGSWQIDRHDVTDLCVWTVRHHHHPVCEQDGLVDVMGDADRRHLGPCPDIHEDVLQFPARQAVQHAEGLVEQEQLR